MPHRLLIQLFILLIATLLSGCGHDSPSDNGGGTGGEGSGDELLAPQDFFRFGYALSEEYEANCLGSRIIRTYAINDLTGQIRLIDRHVLQYVYVFLSPCDVRPPLLVSPSGDFIFVSSRGTQVVGGTIRTVPGVSAIPIDPNGLPNFDAPIFSATRSRGVMTLHPSGAFAYQINPEQNTVDQYSIDVGGRFSSLMPAGIVTGAGASPVAMHPSGNFAYIASGVGDFVWQYAVAVDGSLSSLPGVALTGDNPVSITISPSGAFAYVGNAGSTDISQFSVDAAGFLQPLSPPSVDMAEVPASIAMDTSGDFLYAVNRDAGTISQFQVSVGGGLVPLVPAEVNTALNAKSIEISPGGNFAYVFGQDADDVYQYSISSSGALSLLKPATFPIWPERYLKSVNQFSFAPGEAARRPTAKFAYVANSRSSTVSQYAIDVNGELGPLSPADAISGGSPIMVVRAPDRITKLYTVNTELGTLNFYTVDTDGALVAGLELGIATNGKLISDSDRFGRGPAPTSLTFGSDFAYITDAWADRLLVYRRRDTGDMLAEPRFILETGKQPVAAVLHPGGRFIYVVNGESANISQFSIDGVDGSLAPLSPATVSTAGTPGGMAISPDGSYAYVANISANTVAQYSIGSDGVLKPFAAASVPAERGARSVTIDPTGSFAYVANFLSGTVSQFKIGSNGALTPLTPASVAAGFWPYSVTIDPSGQFAFVTNQGSDDVSMYSIASNGTLSPARYNSVASGAGPSGLAIFSRWQ